MGQAHCYLLLMKNEWERIHNRCIALVVAFPTMVTNLNIMVTTTAIIYHCMTVVEPDCFKKKKFIHCLFEVKDIQKYSPYD